MSVPCLEKATTIIIIKVAIKICKSLKNSLEKNANHSKSRYKNMQIIQKVAIKICKSLKNSLEKNVFLI